MLTKLSLLVSLLVLLGLLGAAQQAQATTYTTIAAGDWTSASTWSDGQIPPTHLAGHVVTINHRVNYPNSLADLFIESGTLNVQNVLILQNVNLKMGNSSGQVNINQGVVISTNGGFENIQGIVTFTDGAVQLCAGGYKVENSAQSTGNGYVFDKAGNIERLGSAAFGTGIDWCIDAGDGIGLPTQENCGVAQPPSGDCLSETHYLTLFSYDYGDAPASYGEAKHKIPAPPSVYLGATPPDAESSSQSSANADGDDANGTNDEDAFSSLPDLDTTDTSYTLSASCAGTGMVAGWIDFDQSGAFTNSGPNEGASATCSSNTATLDWNNASGNFPASLTAGTTSARLRIEGPCKGNGLFGKTSVTISSSTVDSYIDDPLNPGSAGQVGSNGDITITGSGVVHGDATASGTISGTVTGTKTAGAPVTSFPPVAACSPYSGSGGISATGGLTHDTATGDISVPGGNTLTLAPGTYCFNQFTLSGGGVLNITGPTTIYLTAKGTFSGGTFDNTTLNPDNLKIFSNSELVLSSGGTHAYMSIYAPDSKLTISGGGNFYGRAVGGAVTLSGGTTFHAYTGPCSGALNPTGTAWDGEVEDYSLSITNTNTNTCTTLTGDVSEVAPAVPPQVESGDKVFVGSRTPSPAEGHLKAYTVQSDGSISTTAAWDAASLMNATKRENGLYSTDAAGAKILFNSLDDAAFSATTPNAATIRSYTLDPSFSGGDYLAGRMNGSFLGPISRGNSLALITQAIDMQRYLNDNAYRSFYDGTVSSRSEKVLATSDDGFLYAFNQTDGQLAWGWIPRSLVQTLKSFDTFQESHVMSGKLDVIDAIDGSGNYATYVVGSYKNGLGHYVLKLTATAELNSVVWDEDRSSSFATSSNLGEMDYFSDGAGNTYVTYVLTNGSNLSTLIIHNLITTDKTEVALNFNATSTPFVMPDFGDANGPAKKTLYLGDSNGNIRRVALLVPDTSTPPNLVLDTAVHLQTALQSTTYSAQLGASEPILFLGASVSAADRKYYMRAQSENRLTVLRYDTSSTNWVKSWTSHVGGAGAWDTAGTTFTADTSGPPTDLNGDGVLDVTATGIQSLPTGTKITDAAQIVADSVILPVSVPINGACFGNAYFYFYKLASGAFPDNKFTIGEGTFLVENLVLGFGNPTRATISDIPSKEQMQGLGGTDQLSDNSTGVTPSFNINDTVSTGLRGWKEIERD